MSSASYPTGQVSQTENATQPMKYGEHRNALGRIGFAALPVISTDRKAPSVPFGYLTEFTEVEGWKKEICKWASTHSSACWLLDAMAGSPVGDLDVIDVDDLSDLQWALATFGTTPLTVSTGRVGGGVHLYYRRDPSRARDEYGSMAGLVDPNSGRKTKVDLRTWHGYAIAPGSLHKSGRVYQLFWNGVAVPGQVAGLTLDQWRSVPVLNRDVLDPCRTTPEGAPWQDPVGFFAPTVSMPTGRVSHARSTKKNKMPKQAADSSTAMIPGGGTVAAHAATLADGWHSILCPHRAGGGVHANSKDPELTQLLVQDHTAISVSCIACNSLYVYAQGRVPKKTPKNPVSIGMHRIDLSDPKNSRYLTASGHLDPAEILDIHPETIRAAKGLPTICLQVGRGRGKTTAIAAAVRRFRSTRPQARVVAVAPIRSLVTALSESFGLPHYDLQPTGPIHGSVAICTPSLYRIDLYGDQSGVQEWTGVEAVRPVDFLILEEIEQQLFVLLGSHLDDYQATRTWRALIELVATSKYLILLDADAGPLTLELLEAAGRPMAGVTWYHGLAEKTWSMARYEDPAHFHLDLDAAYQDAKTAGKGISVFCASVAEAQALAVRYPGPGTVLLTGGVDASVGDFNLARPQDWAGTTTTLLIYTPVLGTGVSIDTPDHFQSIWAYGHDSTGLTADAVLQAISRVRHPKDRMVRAYFRAGAKPEPWQYDADKVLERWRKASYQAEKMAGVDSDRRLPEWLVFDPGTRTRVVDASARSYSRMMAAVYAERVIAGAGWTGDALSARVRAAGGQVVAVAPTITQKPDLAAIRKEVRASKEVAKQHQIERIETAPVLAEEKLKELRLRGPRNRTESLTLAKSKIEAFYGRSDAETIEFDDGGRGRGHVRAWCHVAARIEGGARAEAVEEHDRREARRGVSAPRRRNYSLRARCQARLLKELGLNGIFSASPTTPIIEIDPTIARHVAYLATTDAGRLVCQFIGVRVRSDVLLNPMQLVGSILGTVGVSMRAKKINGARSYYVDMADVAELRDYGAAYWTRLAAVSGVDVDAEDTTPIPASGIVDAEKLAAMLDELAA